MKFRTPHAPLLGLSMLFSTPYALADDNVCAINNSSQSIQAEALDGNTSWGELDIDAKGGDQNKCWALPLSDVQAGFDPTGLSGVSRYDILVGWPGSQITVGFTNPVVGSGYFTATPDRTEWPANEKICQGPICIWHTDKTDVWRLYIEDAPVSDPCSSLLNPECNE